MLNLLRSHPLPDGMQPGAASADGRRFVAYGKGGGCALFDDGLREVGRVRASGEPRWVQLSGDGSLLLVGLDDRIEEYDAARGGERTLTLPVRGRHRLRHARSAGTSRWWHRGGRAERAQARPNWRWGAGKSEIRS